MLKELIKDCSSLAILGMCKNAGKTTVLNRLLGELKDENIALTSVGKDGESADTLYGTSKPKIHVNKGTIFATTKGLLSSLDVTYEIVGTTDISTPLGDVVILRAQSSGFVQVSGASTTFQTLHLKERFSLLGASRIVIDGAMSRKSLGTASLVDGIILCSGASQSPKIHIAVAETVHAAELLNLRELDAPTDNTVYIKGALTDAVAAKVIKENPNLDTIVLEDSTKALIAQQSMRLLEYRDIRLMVQRLIKVFAITVNPVAVSGANYDLEEYMIAMSNATDLPIIDVVTGETRNM